jgi:hypothetical protein
MKTEKVQRKIDVSEEDLSAIMDEIKSLHQQFISECSDFLNISKDEGLQTMDLYISAVVNRCLSIMAGFRQLCSVNNYIVAAALIRIQIDNLLRLYAATIVTDRDDFFLKYLAGEHIRNLTDTDGKKMTDNYLVTKLDGSIFPGIHNLYTNTSGYVHLSNEHSLIHNEANDQNLVTRIGLFDFFKIDQKVDFAYNMLVASQFLFKVVHSWTLFRNSERPNE